MARTRSRVGKFKESDLTKRKMQHFPRQRSSSKPERACVQLVEDNSKKQKDPQTNMNRSKLHLEKQHKGGDLQVPHFRKSLAARDCERSIKNERRVHAHIHLSS